MLFIDLESTGLLKSRKAELNEQPHITEIYIAKVHPDLKKFYGEYHSLIKPPIPIPEHITKLTGIDNTTVKNSPSFMQVFPTLASFVVGQQTIVAHNAHFDLTLLEIELERINKVNHFPWPMKRICTAIASMQINNGKRMKLSELHEWATGKPHKDKAHRGKADVMALIRCYKELVDDGVI